MDIQDRNSDSVDKHGTGVSLGGTQLSSLRNVRGREVMRSEPLQEALSNAPRFSRLLGPAECAQCLKEFPEIAARMLSHAPDYALEAFRKLFSNGQLRVSGDLARIAGTLGRVFWGVAYQLGGGVLQLMEQEMRVIQRVLLSYEDSLIGSAFAFVPRSEWRSGGTGHCCGFNLEEFLHHSV